MFADTDNWQLTAYQSTDKRDANLFTEVLKLMLACQYEAGGMFNNSFLDNSLD